MADGVPHDDKGNQRRAVWTRDGAGRLVAEANAAGVKQVEEARSNDTSQDDVSLRRESGIALSVGPKTPGASGKTTAEAAAESQRFGAAESTGGTVETLAARVASASKELFAASHGDGQTLFRGGHGGGRTVNVAKLLGRKAPPFPTDDPTRVLPWITEIRRYSRYGGLPLSKLPETICGAVPEHLEDACERAAWRVLLDGYSGNALAERQIAAIVEVLLDNYGEPAELYRDMQLELSTMSQGPNETLTAYAQRLEKHFRKMAAYQVVRTDPFNAPEQLAIEQLKRGARSEFDQAQLWALRKDNFTAHMKLATKLDRRSRERRGVVTNRTSQGVSVAAYSAARRSSPVLAISARDRVSRSSKAAGEDGSWKCSCGGLNYEYRARRGLGCYQCGKPAPGAKPGVVSPRQYLQKPRRATENITAKSAHQRVDALHMTVNALKRTVDDNSATLVQVLEKLNAMARDQGAILSAVSTRAEMRAAEGQDRARASKISRG